jgi:hypothetical protein
MPTRATSFVLAVLLAAPAASALEDPLPPPNPVLRDGEEPAPQEVGPAPAEDGEPAVVDTVVEVRGNRYRIKLAHGAQIEGVLPSGVKWERLDQYGEYEECKETEKGAGLRLGYVLGMEGDIHILRKDITDIRDLGALTDEEQRAIRDRVIAARKKVIEQREKALREDLRRMAEEQRERDAQAAGQNQKSKEKEKAAEQAETKRGEELLKKFPPDQWSEQRLKDILQREIVNGIFRNAEEREFIENFKEWQAAQAKRQDAGDGPPPSPPPAEEKKEEETDGKKGKKMEKVPVETRPAEKTPPEDKKPESGGY